MLSPPRKFIDIYLVEVCTRPYDTIYFTSIDNWIILSLHPEVTYCTPGKRQEAVLQCCRPYPKVKSALPSCTAAFCAVGHLHLDANIVASQYVPRIAVVQQHVLSKPHHQKTPLSSSLMIRLHTAKSTQESQVDFLRCVFFVRSIGRMTCTKSDVYFSHT